MEEIFKTKLPLCEKVDFVFLPNLDIEAMEHVGMVTYDDQIFLKDTEAADQDYYLYRTYVICHELAHMYFGNYVTLDWWDETWLNESFADFFGY